MKLREEAKVINQLTFSTERKYMATLVDSPIQKNGYSTSKVPQRL